MPQNKYGAQRALQRNAELVSRQLMVGVQLLDARMRTLAHSVAPSASAGGMSASSALSTQSSAQQLRPHRIQPAHSQVRPCPVQLEQCAAGLEANGLTEPVGAGNMSTGAFISISASATDLGPSAQGGIPQSTQSTLAMVKEFVFGL